MNVTERRPPRVTQFDDRGLPVEAVIPSRSKPGIEYTLRLHMGRWIHQGKPCEAASFGAECYHKQALERLRKEMEEAMNDIIDGEVTRAVTVGEPSGLVRTDVKAALAAWEDYQTLTKALLNESDYQDTGGGKKFKKKSAWRKYANAFTISDRVTFEEIKRDERGRVLWARLRVEAYHQGTGRRAEAGHECHVLERCCPAADGEKCPKATWERHTCCALNCTGFIHWSHPGDVTETALTRAKNRAISDLIGAGEVSAEEMTDGAAGAADAGPRGGTERAPSTNGAPVPPGVSCPKHAQEAMKYVKAGVNKQGKAYNAFWVCDVKDCAEGRNGKAYIIFEEGA